MKKYSTNFVDKLTEIRENPNFTKVKFSSVRGLDFYCEYPYPVVGECKATKSEKVPDGTAAQLIKLGYKHLQKHFEYCVKIILAAGELTQHALLREIQKINCPTV